MVKAFLHLKSHKIFLQNFVNHPIVLLNKISAETFRSKNFERILNLPVHAVHAVHGRK